MLDGCSELIQKKLRRYRRTFNGRDVYKQLSQTKGVSRK